VFFWGQDYFGAAEAYLIAACMAMFGSWPWLVFVPPILASLALVPVTAMLANQLGRSPAGLIAAIPIALPPPILARQLVTSAGGFSLGFALMLVSLVCLLEATEHMCTIRWLALAALCAGFAMWIWQPALVALPPVLLVVLLRMRCCHPWRELAGGVAPMAIGLIPPVVYNAQRGWPTLSAMLIKSSDTPLSGDTPLARLGSFAGLMLTALGGGDDSLGDANPLQAAVLVSGIVVGVFLLMRMRTWWSLGLVTLFIAFHTLAAYEVSRYFVPLICVSCALFGVAVARLRGAFVAGLIVGLANLGMYPSAVPVLAAPQLASLEDTQAARAALEERGLTRGYADYWAAYPITYLSGEHIIVAPSIPFDWRARTDRYPPYTRLVDADVESHGVFVLVDQRCSMEPYTNALDRAAASYQITDVARWHLVWGVQPNALGVLREAIEAASC
jgi:hypothetical protein